MISYFKHLKSILFCSVFLLYRFKYIRQESFPLSFYSPNRRDCPTFGSLYLPLDLTDRVNKRNDEDPTILWHCSSVHLENVSGKGP